MEIALTVDWSQWTILFHIVILFVAWENRWPKKEEKLKLLNMRVNELAIYLFIAFICYMCPNDIIWIIVMNVSIIEQKIAPTQCFMLNWAEHWAHRRRESKSERDWNEFCNIYGINLYQLISLMNFIWDCDEGASGH